jgi:quercetin dioxygenase-like cupin family protein
VNLHIWNEIPAQALSPQMSRRMIHRAMITIARLSLRAGAVVPRHGHESEQVSTVVSGRLRFVLDGCEVEVGAGESIEIPSNVAHEVRAMEDSEVLDLFSPRREDWMRGEDAYLRG